MIIIAPSDVLYSKNPLKNVVFSDQRRNGQKTQLSNVNNLKQNQDITLRLIIWQKYYQKIIDDKKILILGDKEREMDTIYRSAHNLFLDIIYKFGLILVFLLIFL